MRGPRKTTFQDYEINKISSGSLLCEKPVFCNNGSKLLVSSSETLQLYSATTGEHLNELFTCLAPIISLQVDFEDADKIYAITQKGHIYKYYVPTDEPPVLLCTLSLDPKKLNDNQVLHFKSRTVKGFKHIEWNSSVLEEVCFDYAVIVKEKVYASWSLSHERHSHCSIFHLDTGSMKFIFTHLNLQKIPENLAIGNDFVLLLSYDYVYVEHIGNKTGRKHNIGRKDAHFTRVATHRQPDAMFATGDSTGAIVVWRNIFEKSPLKEIYHWHTLPVQALAFTDCASHMLSGADENVLVKWSLASCMKNFLPRLSAGIQHISCSAAKGIISVTTADSRILVLTLNLSCLATIQHFSRWAPGSGTILAQDPRTEVLVLSARIGHVQFLSTADRGRFLYTLDVTQRNVITRERSKQGANVDVSFVRFTRCGKWLITVESSKEETRLKFWQFDGGQQQWTLNTDVDAPHGPTGVNSLEVSSGELVVTSGPDKSFRLWGVIEAMHLQQVRLHWAMLSCGEYRELDCGPLDFARDGSLLGVGFGPSLTLWDTDACTLRSSLTAPLQRRAITAVRFGRQDVSHLAVAGTDMEISCWNVVTLCRQWTVPLKLTLLVSDPSSSYMCAFSQSRGLFIFDPSSPQVEFRLEKVSESLITAALFTARADAPYLYFLTAAQELYCLGATEKPWNSLDTGVSSVTAFAATLPHRSQVDVKRSDVVKRVERFSAEMLEGPAHALPHVALLCEDVLRALLVRDNSASMQSTLTETIDIQVLETTDRLQQSAVKITESELQKTVAEIFGPKIKSKIIV